MFNNTRTSSLYFSLTNDPQEYNHRIIQHMLMSIEKRLFVQQGRIVPHPR